MWTSPSFIFPYFYSPICTAWNEYIRIELIVIHFIHRHVMCFIYSEVKGGIGCAAFVNIAFLCANQEDKAVSGMERNGCSTSYKINQNTYFCLYALPWCTGLFLFWYFRNVNQYSTCSYVCCLSVNALNLYWLLLL